jgi:hypothetical protein
MIPDNPLAEGIANVSFLIVSQAAHDIPAGIELN